MYLPGLPRMADDLGATTAAAQVTLTTCVVGLALGQLVAGALSDARGRRPVLLLGLGAYAAASLLCALAPTVWTLAAIRLLQGAAGGAGIVIARAVVRDRWSGTVAAQTFSALLIVNGLAPILAPVLGGQLLRVTDWRGVFVVLALIGALLLLAAARGLEESLAAQHRRSGGLRASLTAFAGLLRDRAFVGCALAGGLAFGALFAYISGSPFVLQDVFGLSESAFSAVFALNSVGIVVFGLLGRRAVARLGPARLLTIGLGVQSAAGIVLLAAAAADAPLAGILAPLVLVVAPIGLIAPNAAALGMERHPEVAGSASALLGLSQFAIGAAAAPLVGLFGAATAVPMAAVVAGFALAALAARTALAPAAARR